MNLSSTYRAICASCRKAICPESIRRSSLPLWLNIKADSVEKSIILSFLEKSFKKRLLNPAHSMYHRPKIWIWVEIRQFIPQRKWSSAIRVLFRNLHLDVSTRKLTLLESATATRKAWRLAKNSSTWGFCPQKLTPAVFCATLTGYSRLLQKINQDNNSNVNSIWRRNMKTCRWKTTEFNWLGPKQCLKGPHQYDMTLR